jgi:DNA-binding NarL/FixJ family response regulator
MKKVMLLASQDLCDILQCTLEHTYTTLPCCDPVAGTEMLREKPDILILSLSLPRMDGIAFLIKNAAVLPPVVIVLTTLLSEEIIRKISALPVAALFRLPVRAEELITTIDSFAESGK